MKKEILKKHLNYLKQDFWGEIRFLIRKVYNTLFSLLTTYISRSHIWLGANSDVVLKREG